MTRLITINLLSTFCRAAHAADTLDLAGTWRFGWTRMASGKHSIGSRRRCRERCNWFRVNPHRLQLGNIGLELIKRDGSPATLEDLDLQDIHQELILWTGEIRSHFSLEGIPVDVSTVAHPDIDEVAFRIRSPLIRAGRLRVRVRFPYPTGAFADAGDDWGHPALHREWQSTWGWDYPLVAMTATRLGLADHAIDALLMPVKKNTYLIDGHNYQDARLRIYLPGNGGLLAAVALMCAGYDGCRTADPGIPRKWKVKWEGLYRMP